MGTRTDVNTLLVVFFTTDAFHPGVAEGFIPEDETNTEQDKGTDKQKPKKKQREEESNECKFRK